MKEVNQVLTVSEIRQNCYYQSTYSRGRDLYFGKKYQYFQIDCESDTGTMTVTAQVKGSGTAWYQSQLTISQDGNEIEDYSCECLSYQQTSCMCKHCVAIALAFQAEQKIRVQYVFDAPESPMEIQRSSDYALKQMLRQFHTVNDAEAASTVRGVRLEPSFKVDYSGKMAVEFQIGITRMYVVKDIVCLLAAVEQRAEIRYGKNLEFAHVPEAFTPEALHWLNTMKDIVVVEQQIQDLSDRNLDATQNSPYRSLILGAYGTQRCLSYYLDKDVPIPGMDKTVVSGNPPLTLRITGEREGASMTIPEGNLWILMVYKQLYLVGKDTIYCCSEDYSQTMLPLLQRFGISPKRPYYKSGSHTLFMASSDYRSFCRYVLPRIEPYVTIVTQDFDIQSYQPIPPQFQIYLTMPEAAKTNSREMLFIEARCCVLYGEQKFELADDSRQHESLRDTAAERKAEQLLRQYFPDHSVRFCCAGEEHTLTLLQEGVPKLQEMAELMIEEKILAIRVNAFPKVTFGISLSNGLLNLQIDSELENPEEIYDILQSYRKKKKYHRLKSGELMGKHSDCFGRSAMACSWTSPSCSRAWRKSPLIGRRIWMRCLDSVPVRFRSTAVPPSAA